MKTFVCFLIGAMLADIIGKLVLLARGESHERTPVSNAVDVAFNGALVVWGFVVLAA